MILDATGLKVDTQADLIAIEVAKYLAIYGVDLSALPSDNPDVQLMMTRVQATLDMQGVVLRVYNGMDPDQAIGAVLDQRLSINGIKRQQGTYTITPITISTIAASLNLDGLDASTNPFTVADKQGNKWSLAVSQVGLLPGDHILSFRAALPGAILTTPNTITEPVTIVLGVSAINNPSGYTSLGINEEKDSVARLRRQRSVSQQSRGFNASMKAALENINGIISASIYENRSGALDGSGVPGHSIWVILDGAASAATIAQAIYSKLDGGPGMFGSQSYVIVQSDGTQFVVNWDFVVQQNLFIQFTATSLDGQVLPNIAAIRQGLSAIFIPRTYEEVNINKLATLVQQIDPNCLVTSAGFAFTAAGPFTPVLSPSTRNRRFSVNSSDTTQTAITVTPL